VFRVLPIGIDTIELVAEQHAFGNGKAERGVVISSFRYVLEA